MRASDFSYILPEGSIAQEPLADRSASRLLVVRRDKGTIEHARFRDVSRLLDAGDVIVVNDTRVSAFRLKGRKPTGAVVEALVTRRLDERRFVALMKPGRRLHPGDRVEFGPELTAEVIERRSDGSRIIEMSGGDIDESIGRLAETPLPPYIKKPLRVSDRYQTVYGSSPGSSAAPTAGLHFTDEVLQEIRAAGIGVATVTLHVGASTFRPLRSENLEEHSLAPEAVTVSEEAADIINSARGRVVAVGTTSARTLEASATGEGRIRHWSGATDLFIKPGHQFRVVDGLLTNFHMPRSTLLVLVAAFARRELVLEAYRQALEDGYRFLSLGDAMLVL